MKQTLLVLSIIALPFLSKAQPCAGTPNPGSNIISTPSVTCPYTQPPIVLDLVGFTVASGITFQWEYSTNNITWQAITGANNSAYVINSSIIPTYFRVVVTCNNSALSASSPTIAVGFGPNCQDSVWPGDVNYDLIVDNFDALDLATVYGNTGPVRTGASILYFPQYCADWTNYFTSGYNVKNADCDGNGTANISDTLAIFNNYGMVHPKGAHTPQPKTTTDPDLYFDHTGIPFIPGTTVSVPVKLGTGSLPMNNILGLAAKIHISGTPPPASSFMSYPSSWIGNSANTLRFAKSVSNGQLDWAYARTDHQNISGNGTIANFNFIVPFSSGQVILYMDDVKMIDNAGNVTTSYNVLDDSFQISTTGIEEINKDGVSAFVVPNPSGDQAELQFSLDQNGVVAIDISDITGRIVWKSSEIFHEGTQSIPLPASRLKAGLYFIRISKESGRAQAIKWIKE